MQKINPKVILLQHQVYSIVYVHSKVNAWSTRINNKQLVKLDKKLIWPARFHCHVMWLRQKCVFSLCYIIILKLTSLKLLSGLNVSSLHRLGLSALRYCKIFVKTCKCSQSLSFSSLLFCLETLVRLVPGPRATI